MLDSTPNVSGFHSRDLVLFLSTKCLFIIDYNSFCSTLNKQPITHTPTLTHSHKFINVFKIHELDKFLEVTLNNSYTFI